MNKEELQKLMNVDTTMIQYKLLVAIKEAPWELIYPIAYIIAKTGGKKTKDYHTFLDEYQVKLQLHQILFSVKDKWDIINGLTDTCSADECKALILFDNSLCETEHLNKTPEGVAVLAAKLMKMSSDKKVADLCAGTLSFALNCVDLGINCDYLGSETNLYARNLALLRADFLGDMVNVTFEKPLKINGRFDYVFCHSIFGKKWKEYYPDCGHSASADWLFAQKCVELLYNSGKAVCLITNGSTRNQCDRKMREKFIKSGYIESIIALPEKLYNNTAISSTLIVLSKGNNAVNFVDATKLFTSNRRINQLSGENITAILKSVGKNSSISCTIKNDKIAANDYKLYPQNYTERQPNVRNAVPFSELIERITRGAQIKASELDGLVCDNKTNIKLLMLSDMSKGIISEKLPYLRKLEKRYEKYCASDGAIILSKNGIPIKTAVTNISGKEKILVNGNLYIIELDKTKADPYYIKAYFDSEQGQSQLRNICVGVTIPNIPVEALKMIPIPLCSLKEQKLIADKYRQKQQEVIKLQKMLEAAEQELTHFF